MNFLIISKKEGFSQSQINDKYLKSNKASGTKADESFKLSISNFDIYIIKLSMKKKDILSI